MAAEPPEDPFDDILDHNLLPATLKDSHVPDATPDVTGSDLLGFLMHSKAAERSSKFMNEAEELYEAIQEPNAMDPSSRFSAKSPNLDIAEQRGPPRYIQRGPSSLQTTSEPNEDDKFESEDRVNSSASGNSRFQADSSRGKNFERRTFIRRPAHSENTENIPDENVEIQQNKAQKRKVSTLDPVSEVRRRSLLMKDSTSGIALEGRSTRRKIIPPLKHWLGQSYIYEPCHGKLPMVVGWKEALKEADNVYKWEEMRFQD